MARIRTIKPEFWQDEKVGRLSIPARLLFIGMWNFADDCGVVRGHPVFLKSQILPYDDLSKTDIESWLQELLSQEMLSVFMSNSEIFYKINNFLKHQVINKPSKNKNPQPPITPYINTTVTLPEQSSDTTVTLPERCVREMEREMEREKEKERKKTTTCSEPKKPDSELVAIPSVLSIPLVCKKSGPQLSYDICQAQIDDWAESYPAVDVIQELRNLRQWNISNPDKRKTKTGILKHITSWLARVQNNGGSKHSHKPITGDRKLDISLQNAAEWVMEAET